MIEESSIEKICSFMYSLQGKDDSIEYLAVLILYREKKCIGRINVSRILDLTERTARRIIYDLHSLGLLDRRGKRYCYRGDGILDKVEIERKGIDGRVLTVYIGIDRRVLDNIISNYSFFRDQIVISSGDSSVFEVFGVVMDNNIVIPGLPGELYNIYVDLLKKYKMLEYIGDSLFVIWRRYKPYIYDAVVLSSLCKLPMHS